MKRGLALACFLFALPLLAQDNLPLPFTLHSNDGKILTEAEATSRYHFNRQQAMAIYDAAVTAVVREYHLAQRPAPDFVLTFGGAKHVLNWPDYQKRVTGEAQMPEWRPEWFAQVVVALSINELLRPENIQRLALEAHRWASDALPWQELKKK